VSKARKAEARHEIFCREYLCDLNATRAAIAAGYSEKTAKAAASRLLTNVDVKRRIEELLAKKTEKLDITVDYVLSTIQDTLERCRQATPVLDKKGNPVLVTTPAGELAAAYAFNSLGVLKGCELLGKYLKLFTDRQEIAGDENSPIRVEIIHVGSKNTPSA
jgi:phage terminase small subunit